ncbi:hypothetical protein E2C01_069405 [Portunus trituberculatus]|uniref:Uncharacterized protein n=1 Tax=Portunus trituberculatus TaxID=210409 RepID=A0A5B7HUG0_PORTR|nr:hypothetical protein [Portunus trituberculatus]
MGQIVEVFDYNKYTEEWRDTAGRLHRLTEYSVQLPSQELISFQQTQGPLIYLARAERQPPTTCKDIYQVV